MNLSSDRTAQSSPTAMAFLAFVPWLAVAMLACGARSALAQGSTPTSAVDVSCDVHESLAASRPDLEDVTTVRVGLYLIDVKTIDDLNQVFSADLFVRLRWRDPRLSEAAAAGLLAGCNLPLERVWNPRAFIVNSEAVTARLADVVSVEPDGTVTYVQRYFGEFSVPLDLEDFPFDVQTLAIRISSFGYGPEEIAFVADEEVTGRRDDFTVVGWSIQAPTTKPELEYFAPQDRDMSAFGYELEAKRNSGFYTWKLIVPLGMIVFMSWSVFWIDPKHVAPRMGISATSVLTLFAYQFSLSSLLPRVSYLTRMDQFILGASALVFLGLVESVITIAVTDRGSPYVAKRVDRWCRLLFPLSFAALIAVVFTQ